MIQQVRIRGLLLFSSSWQSSTHFWFLLPALLLVVFDSWHILPFTAFIGGVTWYLNYRCCASLIIGALLLPMWLVLLPGVLGDQRPLHILDLLGCRCLHSGGRVGWERSWNYECFCCDQGCRVCRWCQCEWGVGGCCGHVTGSPVTAL